ncbi:hypothetical protein [Bacillus sp. NPDC077027]|uniref:response regulator aspartate phosphatase n=1 Tax=Bacillus sp. NPDC077027 TaxID=3390548 RepID=UPI003D06AF10
MTRLIASQEVGNMINTWNLAIQKGDLSAAIEMQDDIDKAIESMEENQDILLYYQLLSFRLKLKLQNISRNLDKRSLRETLLTKKKKKQINSCHITSTFIMGYIMTTYKIMIRH